MKSRRNLHIGIGLFFIIINLLADMVQLSETNTATADTPYSIGYFIGSHILFIFGLVFLRMAYKANKKIKPREESLLERSIHTIGDKEARN